MNPTQNPISPVMPTSVVELLEAVKVNNDTVALRLYILTAVPDIIAAYQRIEDLEKENIYWEDKYDKVCGERMKLESQLAVMGKAGHEMYRDISILNQELTVGQEAWRAASNDVKE